MKKNSYLGFFFILFIALHPVESFGLPESCFFNFFTLSKNQLSFDTLSNKQILFFTIVTIIFGCAMYRNYRKNSTPDKPNSFEKFKDDSEFQNLYHQIHNLNIPEEAIIDEQQKKTTQLNARYAALSQKTSETQEKITILGNVEQILCIKKIRNTTEEESLLANLQNVTCLVKMVEKFKFDAKEVHRAVTLQQIIHKNELIYHSNNFYELKRLLHEHELFEKKIDTMMKTAKDLKLLLREAKP